MKTYPISELFKYLSVASYGYRDDHTDRHPTSYRLSRDKMNKDKIEAIYAVNDDAEMVMIKTEWAITRVQSGLRLHDDRFSNGFFFDAFAFWNDFKKDLK